jgi:hypothetical protein
MMRPGGSTVGRHAAQLRVAASGNTQVRAAFAQHATPGSMIRMLAAHWYWTGGHDRSTVQHADALSGIEKGRERGKQLYYLSAVRISSF